MNVFKTKKLKHFLTLKIYYWGFAAIAVCFRVHSVTNEIQPGPHMNRQKWFREIFCFWVYTQSTTSRHLNFSFDTAVFKFFNYCYWMCKQTQISFLPDCSFKVESFKQKNGYKSCDTVPFKRQFHITFDTDFS